MLIPSGTFVKQVFLPKLGELEQIVGTPPGLNEIESFVHIWCDIVVERNGSKPNYFSCAEPPIQTNLTIQTDIHLYQGLRYV